MDHGPRFSRPRPWNWPVSHKHRISDQSWDLRRESFRIHAAVSSKPDAGPDSPSILHAVLPVGAEPNTTSLPPVFSRPWLASSILSPRRTELNAKPGTRNFPYDQGYARPIQLSSFFQQSGCFLVQSWKYR